MKITEVTCKTALSKSNLPGLDYSLNPYRGCQHNCRYCYVPNVLRIERKNWGSFVDVKTNIHVVLSTELKKKKPGIVAISTVTDPYQPIEGKYKLTRYCLEQLLIHDFPVNIQTKSDLVTRDIDLISKFTDIEVMFSIGTINDSERKILEPFSSSIQKRLNAMKKISDAGINTSVFFGPIYPTIKKQEMEQIIKTFYDKGANEIMIDKMNFKPGILQNILDSNYYSFSNKHYEKFYNEARKDIIKNCKKYNLKITDAF
jgi:DNA repair photolyase